jgi:branched-chain amino acid transport system ATP-binding protein
VPQGRRVFADLSVRENLTLTAREGGGWGLERVLDLFPSLRQRIANRGDELSGGEQQMLAVGRALMRDPRVLLLDEPSEGLAPKLVEEIREVLQRVRETGLSVLLVEQNLRLATAVAQRVSVMNKGRIVFSGTPAELASDPEVEARYLGI